MKKKNTRLLTTRLSIISVGVKQNEIVERHTCDKRWFLYKTVNRKILLMLRQGDCLTITVFSFLARSPACKCEFGFFTLASAMERQGDMSLTDNMVSGDDA